MMRQRKVTGPALKKCVEQRRLRWLSVYTCLFCNKNVLMHFSPSSDPPVILDTACACVRKDFRSKVREHSGWDEAAARLQALGMPSFVRRRVMDVDGNVSPLAISHLMGSRQ